VHWYQHRVGELETTSFAMTAARQTGIYAAVRELRGEPLRAATLASCGGGMCLRTVVWSGAVHGSGADQPCMGAALVPCREPCSLFLTFAREVLHSEAEWQRLERLAPSGAGRARLAGAFRAAADRIARGGSSPVETADFGNRMNPRWLRYWAERLEGAPEDDRPDEAPGEYPVELSRDGERRPRGGFGRPVSSCVAASAPGPMGARELTTTKRVVYGQGQARQG
jgi:hypothetical protein